MVGFEATSNLQIFFLRLCWQLQNSSTIATTYATACIAKLWVSAGGYALNKTHSGLRWVASIVPAKRLHTWWHSRTTYRLQNCVCVRVKRDVRGKVVECMLLHLKYVANNQMSTRQQLVIQSYAYLWSFNSLQENSNDIMTYISPAALAQKNSRQTEPPILSRQ